MKKPELKHWLAAVLAAAALAGSTASFAEEKAAAGKTAGAAAVADDGDYENYYSAEGIADPLESVNRGIFKFNEVVDKVVMKPVATVYTKAVPKYGRERVTNVVTNFMEPVSMVNGFLQGNPERGFTSFWRFILNSTFGVLGIFDFAGHNLGLVYVDEDFGQTMGVYGSGTGPYIVLPFLGPSNARDALGRVADFFSNPFNYVDSDRFVYGRMVVTAVDARSRNLKLIDEIYETSIDPYATFRSAYTQRREALVRNNQPSQAEVGY